MKRIARFFLILMLILPSFSLYGEEFPNAPSFPINTAQWQSYLNDSTLLSQLTIPATHNAGATVGGILGQCQSLSIKEQLLLGVRFLDLRVKQDLFIYHSIIKQPLTLKEVVEQVDHFLDNNPSEWVVLMLKIEKEKKGESDKVVAKLLPMLLENPHFLPIANEDQPVRSLRGKWILFSRIEALKGYGLSSPKWPLNGTNEAPVGNPFPMMIQDLYSTHQNNEEIKWNHFRMLTDQANQNRFDGVLYLNYLSATISNDITGICHLSTHNPKAFARTMNQRVIALLKTNPNMRMGVTFCDFIDQEADLTCYLIQSNQPYFKESPNIF